MRRRGSQRFAAITYPLIAEWTGLTLDTVRTYGAKGLIPRDNLEHVIEWVNQRRQRRGLPLIGQPPPDEVQPDESTTAISTPPPIPSNYNPLTGEYDD